MRLLLDSKSLELDLTLIQDHIYHEHLGKMIEAFLELLSYIDQIATLFVHNLPFATPF